MYPEDKFQNVGFCKMDPIINGEEEGINFTTFGLDKNKKQFCMLQLFIQAA